MQRMFGAGLLTFTPPGSNQTPIQCGILQDVSIDHDNTIKTLTGQFRAPIDAAYADYKLTGTANFAQIQGAALQQILSGATITTGTTKGAINEVGTIPATPYQVTVANSATFVEDLGVYNTVTQQIMTRVASGPATGQYAVAAGVYTFAAADTTNVVWISYSYTATGGKKVTFTNQLMGQITTFTLTLFNHYSTYDFGIKLFAVVVPKLSFAMKNVDYTMENLSFQAYANGSGQILEQYSTE